MKKKTVLLAALACVAGLSLASCNGGDSPSIPTGSKPKPSVSFDEDSKIEITPVINPDRAWSTSSNLDVHLCYSKKTTIAYNGASSYTNPIDGKTYTNGEQNLLPTWTQFQSRLSTADKPITIRNAAGAGGASEADTYKKVSQGNYLSQSSGLTDQAIDVYYSKTNNLIEAGKANKLLDLTGYLDKMPNFKTYLENNPAVYRELQVDGHIYFTPYLDGYNQVERQLVMDTEIVKTLLDKEIPTGLGLLTSGTGGIAETVKAAKVQPFIDAEHNYAKDKELITIVKGEELEYLEVNQTTNIIKQQNELLNRGCTGKELIDQFKTYLDTAYGVGSGKNYTTYADIFTSVSACYNTDDLVALMRVTKANPDVLFGTATKATEDTVAADATKGQGWREVETLFPRGVKNSRITNILQFASTLYGVQGIGSEKDHLFFGADGCLYDAETMQASYDLLDKLNALYNEGLVLDDFAYKGTDGDEGYKEKYFAKTKVNSSYGLMMYDYSATQSAVNDVYNGLGTATSSRVGPFANTSVKGVTPILGPVSYWGTETGLNPTATLGSTEDRAYKTLTRYYEENRAVKDSSWGIPTNSDNIEYALKLMDDMYSEEGSNLQNYGPQAYWEMGTIMDEASPVLKESVFNAFTEQKTAANGRSSIWDFFRQCIGSTNGFGHVRSSSLDYQSTNEYSRAGYENVYKAINLGAQGVSKVKTKYTWNTSARIFCYATVSSENQNQYDNLTKFWSDTQYPATDVVGWCKVATSANGTATGGVVIGSGATGNTLTQVKDLFGKKNSLYLYTYAESIADECVPDYIQ